MVGWIGLVSQIPLLVCALGVPSRRKSSREGIQSTSETLIGLIWAIVSLDLVSVLSRRQDKRRFHSLMI